MVQVKICGITVLDDALCAVESGADMLGFVFWGPSPRCVEPDAVRLLGEMIPASIKKVGVFVDFSAEEMKRTMNRARLHIAQLHGNETPDVCVAVRKDFPVWKAFRMKDEAVVEQMKQYDVDAYLLDGYVADKPGGTGQRFNWELALRAKELGTPIVLSGGLTPKNVLDAMKVKPYALDVSSGVESTPGKKDHDKIRQFIRRVHGAAVK